MTQSHNPTNPAAEHGGAAQPLTTSHRGVVPAFQAMAITEQVARLRADGRDIISLGVGEPRGGAPAGVADSAKIALGERGKLGYTGALGLAPLRQAVAEHYGSWYGIDVDPAQVAITTGSSGAFLLVYLAAFDSGARVALASPGYPAYRNVLRALGCEVVELNAGPAERFQPTPALLDAAVAEGGKLDGLLVASPANPTGTMLSAAELGALASWCAEHGTRLISDEIYHGMTYGPGDGGESDAEKYSRGASLWQVDGAVASAEHPGVVVSSFSKYWGMTGWRLGWALLPTDLVGPVDALAGNVALAPPTPAQLAALEAFSTAAHEEADARVAEIARTREALLARVPELEWGEVAPMDGAFYLWAHLGPQLTLGRRRFADAAEYCAALLQEAGVALTPGADFATEGAEEYVRLAYGGGTEAVMEAVDRIIAWQAGVRC